jgi:glycerol-3-phosphate cytidylyltransferase
MKKYKIGYTQGVYDMFHIGHLNLINRAKEQCDYLIVGVNSDELVKAYKKKETVIKEQERAEIVRNLKAVDDCIIVDTLDKMELHKRLLFDAIFIGDDWYGNPRWLQTKDDLAKIGVDLVFLPHTDGISSTILSLENDNKIDEKAL